ncbi:hypothetical protein [Xenophilus azovorans]|uniref:hypothetical protein n=1 Tax=Xenophilus azovorans TaxID=151755 RepID=UPI00056E33CB|nr:hypothetical protein [Xenophilus azovorans]
MGIALLTLADLFVPFQSIAGRWMESRHRRRHALRYVAVRPACGLHGSAVAQQALRPARPLKITRLVERGQQGRPAAGGVVISGRMDEVCAELERLAALEAAGSPLTH